jgi:hypothetical protein
MLSKQEALKKYVNNSHGYVVRKEVERVINDLYSTEDTKGEEANETLVETLELANKTIQMQADEIKALEIDVEGYKLQIEAAQAEVKPEKTTGSKK